MKFGMSVNTDVPDAPRLAKRVLHQLEGYEVLMESEVAERFKKKGVKVEDMDVDIMITVGGDGTILRRSQRNKAPIFGINAGDLGFLTEVADEELEEGLENILKGNYDVVSRLKLKTTINKKRLPDAVNEAVVHTAHIAKIRHFQVFVDGSWP